MKRTLAILLALAMLLSCLVACGNQSTESATGNNATGEQTAAGENSGCYLQKKEWLRDQSNTT